MSERKKLMVRERKNIQEGKALIEQVLRGEKPGTLEEAVLHRTDHVSESTIND